MFRVFHSAWNLRFYPICEPKYGMEWENGNRTGDIIVWDCIAWNMECCTTLLLTGEVIVEHCLWDYYYYERVEDFEIRCSCGAS
jgi:hypothetical protein